MFSNLFDEEQENLSCRLNGNLEPMVNEFYSNNSVAGFCEQAIQHNIQNKHVKSFPNFEVIEFEQILQMALKKFRLTLEQIKFIEQKNNNEIKIQDHSLIKEFLKQIKIPTHKVWVKSLYTADECKYLAGSAKFGQEIKYNQESGVLTSLKKIGNEYVIDIKVQQNIIQLKTLNCIRNRNLQIIKHKFNQEIIGIKFYVTNLIQNAEKFSSMLFTMDHPLYDAAQFINCWLMNEGRTNRVWNPQRTFVYKKDKKRITMIAPGCFIKIEGKEFGVQIIVGIDLVLNEYQYMEFVSLDGLNVLSTEKPVINDILTSIAEQCPDFAQLSTKHYTQKTKYFWLKRQIISESLDNLLVEHIKFVDLGNETELDLYIYCGMVIPTTNSDNSVDWNCTKNTLKQMLEMVVHHNEEEEEKSLTTEVQPPTRFLESDNNKLVVVYEMWTDGMTPWLFNHNGFKAILGTFPQMDWALKYFKSRSSTNFHAIFDNNVDPNDLITVFNLMVKEVAKPFQVGNYTVFVKVIAKSADLPEQYLLADILKYNSIKFDATNEEMMNPKFQPRLHPRHLNSKHGVREHRHIVVKHEWLQNQTIWETTKSDLAHNTKNFAEHFGMWINCSFLAGSMVHQKVYQLRLYSICMAVDSVKGTTKTNQMSFSSNVNKSNFGIGYFLLEVAPNFICIAPLIYIPFFCYEKDISSNANYSYWKSISIVCNLLTLGHSACLPKYYNWTQISCVFLYCCTRIGIKLPWKKMQNKNKNNNNDNDNDDSEDEEEIFPDYVEGYNNTQFINALDLLRGLEKIDGKNTAQNKYQLKSPTVQSIIEMIYDWEFVGAGHHFSTLRKETYFRILKEDLKKTSQQFKIHKNINYHIHRIFEERRFNITLNTLLEGATFNEKGQWDPNGTCKIDPKFLQIDNYDYTQHSWFLTNLKELRKRNSRVIHALRQQKITDKEFGLIQAVFTEQFHLSINKKDCQIYKKLSIKENLREWIIEANDLILIKKFFVASSTESLSNKDRFEFIKMQAKTIGKGIHKVFKVVSINHYTKQFYGILCFCPKKSMIDPNYLYLTVDISGPLRFYLQQDVQYIVRGVHCCRFPAEFYKNLYNLQVQSKECCIADFECQQMIHNERNTQYYISPFVKTYIPLLYDLLYLQIVYFFGKLYFQ